METKGKRPTQLNFEEMIDVVADVVNKISANGVKKMVIHVDERVLK